MRSDKDLIEEMIKIIKSYGLENKKIFDAMRAVPRHFFVNERIPIEEIYDDYPLPIGEGQTISQPYTVAFMLDLLQLKKGHNVLEIGTGSGWNAALIENIVGNEGKVTSIEYNKSLFDSAFEKLKNTGSRVEVVHANGRNGYTPNSLYDRIIVTCAAKKMMPSWIKQLKEGGIIVFPEGENLQIMIKAVKKNKEMIREKHGYFRFVPLL